MSRRHGTSRSPTREEVEREALDEAKLLGDLTRDELCSWFAKRIADERSRAGQPAAWLRKIRAALGATSDGHALALAKVLGRNVPIEEASIPKGSRPPFTEG
jgi:hypothetical protein